MASTAFKVIIVGGGVAGLTLANALELAKVEYVLLESKGQFAPAVGASIAIGANGNRVLDQLGCWLGYPIYFCDRHLLLATLYDNIKDKRNLLLNKRVSRIDHKHKTATVQCKDGTTYTGDVIVGADGVHSIVRQEMFRHLEVNEPHLLDPSDKTAMSSEYKCMFGVSKPTSGLDRPGDVGIFNQVLGHDLSFLHSNDKSGRIFWFVFEKLDKKHQFPNIPTFTDDDAVALAHRCSSVQMNDKVTFADIWKNRWAYRLVPLEEALFQRWTWGRLWTPNIGQGSNNAIESAALLANKLFQLAHQTPSPSQKEVEEALKSFYDRRLPRAASTFKLANLAARLEALKSSREEFLALSVIPLVGDWLINQVTLSTVGAEKVDYLPVPTRSFQGTMRFNQASLPLD
ncbi:FAD binding monooxygenase [Cladophialophora carrionii]|uniref:FAD binding monooxygenase n=1 Tax=Cladophialophora carrionii TaxID=86049 RepID=A0A1C1CZH6_9EURO|nr:FAD binding monooxygenase [Cladophialophora carrionii]